MMRWTAPFNVSGNPALVLPGGFTDEGFPISFQLVAAHNNEAALFALAKLFQVKTRFHRECPPAFE